MIFPFYVRQLNLCNKRFSILCSVFVLLASSWKEGEKGTPSIYIHIYIPIVVCPVLNIFLVIILVVCWKTCCFIARWSHGMPASYDHTTFHLSSTSWSLQTKEQITTNQAKKKKKTTHQTISTLKVWTSEVQNRKSDW